MISILFSRIRRTASIRSGRAGGLAEELVETEKGLYSSLSSGNYYRPR